MLIVKKFGGSSVAEKSSKRKGSDRESLPFFISLLWYSRLDFEIPQTRTTCHILPIITCPTQPSTKLAKQQTI